MRFSYPPIVVLFMVGARHHRQWMSSGALQLRIARSFAFEQVKEATTCLEGRSALGKVILIVNESLDIPLRATGATSTGVRSKL